MFYKVSFFKKIFLQVFFLYMSISTFWFSIYYLFCSIFFYISFSRYFLSASYHSTYFQDTTQDMGFQGGIQEGLWRRLFSGTSMAMGTSLNWKATNSVLLKSFTLNTNLFDLRCFCGFEFFILIQMFLRNNQFTHIKLDTFRIYF